MRQTAARLNRAWLAIIGIVLLLAGLVGLLISTGLLVPAAGAVGLGWTHPAPGDTALGNGVAGAFALTWVVVLVVVVSIVLALLALAWVAAQLPRSNEAKPFRLHDTAKTGLTRCGPSVLSDAVAAQVKALPGVQDAAAVIRGTADQPDLTLKVTASDRADLPRLLQTLQSTVATDIGDALDTRLARLGVQIEIDTTRVRTDQITV